MVHDSDAKGSKAAKDSLFGDEVYVADAMPVKARGVGISSERLEELRTERLQDILTDRQGREEVEVLFGSLELTSFGAEAVAQILTPLPEEEHSRGWREGEALAEAWLIDAEACEFPWPFNRDLRHPRASLPGPELIGLTRDTNGDRFVFAQVKTSKERRFPPGVVHHGKNGLVAQLTALHDDRSLKDCVVKYLGYRAKPDQPWCGRYRTAAVRCFNSLAIPAGELERVFHILRLASLAYIGDRWSDLRRWLIENSDRTAAPHAANVAWDKRVLFRVYDGWLRLFRKDSWNDLHGIAEIVAGLREEQQVYEKELLSAESDADTQALAYRLVALSPCIIGRGQPRICPNTCCRDSPRGLPKTSTFISTRQSRPPLLRETWRSKCCCGGSTPLGGEW